MSELMRNRSKVDLCVLLFLPYFSTLTEDGAAFTAFHKILKTRSFDKEQIFACLNAVFHMSSRIPSLLKYIFLSLKQPEDTQDSDIPNVSSTFLF